MNRDELIAYMANVAMIAAADGKLSPEEAKAIDTVRAELGVEQGQMDAALEKVAKGKHKIAPVGRFSDKTRNLEDMIFVALADNEISKAEKPEILSFAKSINISQGQLSVILSEAKNRIKPPDAPLVCPSCGKEIPQASKFCPLCGNKL